MVANNNADGATGQVPASSTTTGTGTGAASNQPTAIDTSISADTSATAMAVDKSTVAAQRKSMTTPTSGNAPGISPTAQDSHPYARGSVIEVWHIDHQKQKEKDEEDWWSDTDSSSDEEEDKQQHEQGKEGGGGGSPRSRHHHTKTVRLCDVIDRAQTQDNAWRYYVHYRDFNRRMDAWVGTDLIVSPPSIGNAKARALKKEEERLKRKQQRKEEKKADELIDWTAPRSRRRSTAQAAPDAGSSDPATAMRRTRNRLSRRKSTLDDDATVVQGNTAAEEDEDKSQARETINKKEVVALPTDAVTTHMFDGHVVATVKAQELDEHEGLDEASLREHEEVTKVKNVSFVEIGQYQMETWYFSPLPKELLSSRGYIEILYVCEFSLNLFARKSELLRFQARLPTDRRHPPGNEIYRNGNLSMFEVDGLEEKIYCQNLCYIAKLFLDHKTLYFDVDPFLFYVLCEVDNRGFHPVGYYSKEKYSDVGYNLACILTFPAHQRKGYGRFLIAFSYELTKKEEKVGSPEKPMSDLG